MNFCLLSKWRWKLDNESGIWQHIIKAKYLRKSEVRNVSHKLDNSPVWADLLKIKHFYLKGRISKVPNGGILKDRLGDQIGGE
jgi:hypothetical protein